MGLLEVQVQGIEGGDGGFAGFFDLEEGFAGSGLEGLPFQIFVFFS